MRNSKPTIWLSFGLVSLTLALALTGYVLGLMPDGHKVELDSRAKVAESLAVQLVGAVNRKDSVVLEETLNSVVKRNDDVYSSALRRSDGTIVISAGDHEKHWIETEDGKSTPTHVSVPLLGTDGEQGTIELAFAPASTEKRILGIPATLLMFLGFLMAFGFIGYFLMLRRALRQLDPGRVIPERVQKAFDTLNEGVIILDEKERILLVNRAFAKIYDDGDGPSIGTKINNLSWRMVDGRALAGGYPWHKAIREGCETRQDILSLRNANGEVHNFDVNATVISDDKEKIIGAIVTLNDMTQLKNNEVELEKTREKLRLSVENEEHHREELAYLSTHDPLSGCMTRRQFMQKLEVRLENQSDVSQNTILVMLDIDGFGRINHDYGYSTGDRIISGVAEIIKGCVGEESIVGRFSGDRFCVALHDDSETDLYMLSQRLLHELSEGARKLYAGGADLGACIGVCGASGGGVAAQTLTNQAEQALVCAKKKGPSQIAYWNRSEDAAVVLDQPTIIKGSEQNMVGSAEDVPLEPTSSEMTIVTDLADFLGRVDQALLRANRTGKQSAVAQISISSWDYLSEALGGSGSQSLMRAIVRSATQSLSEQDDIISVGDTGELLIKVLEVDNRENMERILRQLLADLRAPFEVDGKDVYIACNAGAALFPEDGGTSTILIRNAGAAMRRAKEENRIEGYKFYSADMIESSRERLDIESGIREALQRNEFELFFQPIVDLQTGVLSAAECLLRCNNESLSGVYMDKIIDVAEKSSLIEEIDMWVLEAALRQMQIWCDKGPSLPKVSINLSATQLTNVAFMDRVYDKIKAASFSPSRVQIEVTETAKMADVSIAAPQLKRLQQLGVLIALDDFGTGQASLTYLQRLHPDVIKIDRSFITDVNKNHANATMVSAMTVMSHCLGLKVVVEGVENEGELDFLRQTQCDYVQGYYISKPMPEGVMSDWMKLFMKKTEPNTIGQSGLPAGQEGLYIEDTKPVRAA